LAYIILNKFVNKRYKDFSLHLNNVSCKKDTKRCFRNLGIVVVVVVVAVAVVVVVEAAVAFVVVVSGENMSGRYTVWQ